MAEAPAAACPICGKPRAARFRPFCSKACADRDLLAWLREDYAAPGDAVGDTHDGAGTREADG